MFTTKSTISLLKAANPTVRISEDQIRSFIRREVIPTPRTVAGRYLWNEKEILALAEALELAAPSPAALQEEAVS